MPDVAPGAPVDHLPGDVDTIYEEARRCMSVSAFTASVLCSRKILMNLAVEKGAPEGESFKSFLRLGLLRYPTLVLEFLDPPERKLMMRSKEALALTPLGAALLVACASPDAPTPAIALPRGALPE